MVRRLVLAAAAAQACASVAPASAPRLPCCPTTTRVYSTTAPLNIPDPGLATAVIMVSGAGAYLWDVDLTTFLVHGFTSDLTITLRSPFGTVVTISSGNGTSLQNVFNGTVWDDDAGDLYPPGAVTDATLINNATSPTLVPEEAMGAFIGQNPNGAWQLSINDVSAGASGVLNAASMTITTCDAAPTVTTATASVTQPVGILDQATAQSVVVLGVAGSTLTRITCTTSIRHTACGQLIVTLTSPQGTVVTLTSGNGGANANVFNGTVWRDDAGTFLPPGPVTDALFVNNVTSTPLCPEEAMGAFLGENPNGLWKLSITDTAPGNTGTLDGWSLAVEACGAPPCPNDITGDGVVNAADLARVLGGWGPCP